MAKSKIRIRRTFTSEYKLKTVQLVTEKGFSCAGYHLQHEPKRDCYDNAPMESFFATLKQ